MKKLVSLLLMAAMLLSLCACGEPDSTDDRSDKGGNSTQSTTQPGQSQNQGGESGLEQDEAELICGTWYPHPEVSGGCIEIRSDGTCNLYGQETTFRVESSNAEEVVLDVDGSQLVFSHLQSPVPMLFEDACGYCIPYQLLWQLVGEWRNEDTDAVFYLDFWELPDWGLPVEVEADRLTVTVTDGDMLLYSVTFRCGERPVAEVVEVMNDRVMVFYNVAYGSGSGPCSHVYSVVSTQPGNCLEPGSETLQCQHCGNQYQRSTGTTDHSYVDRVCQVCGAEKPQGTLMFALNAEGTAYTVTGIGTWEEPVVIIPESWEGLPVTEIGERAFEECAFITDVVIPDSIKVINHQAFCGCSSLTGVSIPDSVVTIGGSVFADCKALEYIRIPDTVTSLGPSLFYACSSLKECTIPEGITEIGTTFFYRCTSLTSVTLPDSITSIGQYAFESCISLKHINSPKNLSSLDAHAFSSCEALESFPIPNGVTSLADGVFSGCYNLSITIPKQIKHIGIAAVSSCKEISVEKGLADYYVSGNCLIQKSSKALVCAGLEFTIPTNGSVTVIGGYAFQGNTMRSVVLPDCIEELGEGVFNACLELKSVTWPKGITKIPNNTFLNAGLEHFDIPETVTHIGYYAFSSCEQLKSISIHSGVTVIDAYAFGNCFLLDHVVLPSGITELSTGLFQNCRSLTDVTLPDTVAVMYSAFFNCTALETVTLPKGLKEMYGTFKGCTALKRIEIPSGAVLIGKDTFRGCSALESVVIPDSVTELGDAAFMLCTSLKHIVLPDSLTTIPMIAFSGCTALESVTIPASVTVIAINAFARCEALKTVHFGGTPEQWAQMQIGNYNEFLANAEIVYP